MKSFVEGVYKRPPAGDLNPQIGDLVVAYVEVDNGKQDRVMARVLWPRATCVRARLHGMPKQDNAGSGLGRGFVDIPRSAIAGVVHIKGVCCHPKNLRQLEPARRSAQLWPVKLRVAARHHILF
ncbi:hypothetical protein [Enhygromyxa salina]|uniref:hypothetical protein n=1 Tax=Enhygromyxa salina TaxID=215803 RepID=UPI0011BAB8C4|nr:hypothetical protein [Enhygromyxa salina]